MSEQLKFTFAIIFREHDSRNQWAEKWMVLTAILDRGGRRKIHSLCAGDHLLVITSKMRKLTYWL
jgi:hypothetical protein